MSSLSLCFDHLSLSFVSSKEKASVEEESGNNSHSVIGCWLANVDFRLTLDLRKHANGFLLK
jgi:hypothetical protein